MTGITQEQIADLVKRLRKGVQYERFGDMEPDIDSANWNMEEAADILEQMAADRSKSAMIEVQANAHGWDAEAAKEYYSDFKPDHDYAERDMLKDRAEAAEAEVSELVEMLRIQTDRLNLAQARNDLQAMNVQAAADDLAEIRELKAEIARLKGL